MKYFDTSYLARCYLEDTGWQAVRELAGQEPVACCTLGRAEAAAALHRKLREGSLTAEDHAEVALQFRDDCEAGLWRWLPVNDALAATARSRPAYSSAGRTHCTCCARRRTDSRRYSPTTGTSSPPRRTSVWPGVMSFEEARGGAGVFRACWLGSWEKNQIATTSRPIAVATTICRASEEPNPSASNAWASAQWRTTSERQPLDAA